MRPWKGHPYDRHRHDGRLNPFLVRRDVIHEFTIALIVGLVTGTYSTVYIASPVVLFWRSMSRAEERERGGGRSK